MMKYLHQMLLAVVLLTAWRIAAQDNTTQRLSLLQALALVQTSDTTRSDARFIVDGSYDDDDACWKFEFSDRSEICISDTTGQVVDFDDNSGVPAPAATEEATGSVPAPAATEEADDDIFTVLPTVLLNDAIVTALRIFPNRIVSDFELERNADGVVVWEIKLDNNTVSVDVDAQTGFVLDFGRNSSNDDSDDSSGRGRGSSDSDDDADDNSGRGSNNSGSSDKDDDDDNSGSSGRGSSGDSD